jgi:hypothetical protein
MPFGEAPRELYALIAEKCGAWAAKTTLWLFVGGVSAGSLLGIGLLASKVSEHLVSPYVIPLLKGVRLPSVPSAGIGNLLISILITVTLLVLVGVVALRRFREWESVLGEFMDAHLRRVRARLNHIEANAPSLKSVDENVANLETRIASLEMLVKPSTKPVSHQDALVQLLGREGPKIKRIGSDEVGS